MSEKSALDVMLEREGDLLQAAKDGAGVDDLREAARAFVRAERAAGYDSADLYTGAYGELVPSAREFAAESGYTYRHQALAGNVLDAARAFVLDEESDERHMRGGEDDA